MNKALRGVGNAETQRTYNTAHNVFDFAFGKILQSTHVLRFLIEDASCLGQENLTAAAGGNYQLGAEIVFQSTQLLAEGRLSDMYVISRTGKTTGFDNCQKFL